MLKKMLLCVVASVIAVAATSAFAQDAPVSPVGVKHVVWIGSDGFGAHYVNWDELPNLRKMRDNGAWTLHMRSVLPSSSAICWETQLSGAPSESHGYRDWGSQKPDLPSIYLNEHGRFPDIFRVLRDANPAYRLTITYEWDGVGYLFDQEALDDSVQLWGMDNIYQSGIKQLETKPNFAFIYFHEPDGVGHGQGWGSPEYQKVMTEIDSYVGKILDYLEENGWMDDTVVLFTADHGGSEKGHGDAKMSHMEVPFMLYGKNVKAGEMTDVRVHYDVAPTIAWILGVKCPQCWRGQPATCAFEIK